MENYFGTEEKVFSYMEKNHMVKPGDGVVAGISGGADSVCLFFVLLEMRKRIPFSLSVVHVNHGIRESAGEDEAYVEKLCRNYEIPFFPVHADIPFLSGQRGESYEETGREVRYEAFQRIALKTGSCKIAVAHNRNDQSETFLFHLFRGSGIKGLAGIRPVRDSVSNENYVCQIIRPLLCLERREIEDYLKMRGIAFCNDETNEEDHYARNRIRHHILPYAEKEITTGAAGHIARTAELLAEFSDYLDLKVREAKKNCVTEFTQEGKIKSFEIAAGKFCKLHPVIQKSLIHQLLSSLTPHGKDLSFVHAQAVVSLAEKQKNGQISLPFGMIAKKEYDRILLSGDSETKEPTPPEREVTSLPFWDEENGFFLELNPPGEKIVQPEEKKYTKWFDYDKIKGVLMLRHRRQGDYLTILDREGGEIRKSLKQFFIDRKIPASKRDKILLLADDSHIVWVVGYRISEHYKVRENTERILKAEAIDRKL